MSTPCANAATGRRYSGINVLISWGEVIAGSYDAEFRKALVTEAIDCLLNDD